MSGPAVLRPMPLPDLPVEPLVSVLVTCRDKEPYIGDAIDSALRQDYPSREVVVCDDGSRDGSWEIICGRAAADGRVKPVRTAGLGVGGATNAAFAASRGEILCFLDGDDLFDRGRLQDVVGLFRAHPRAGMALHPAVLIGPDGSEEFGRWPLLGHMPSGWMADTVVGRDFQLPGAALTSAMALRREVAGRIFPMPLMRHNQDAYMAITAMLLTEVASGETITSRYRIHSGQQSRIGEKAFSAEWVDRVETLYQHVRDWCDLEFGAGSVRLPELERSFAYAEAMMAVEKARGSLVRCLGWSRRAAGAPAFAGLPAGRRLFIRAYPLLPARVARAATSPASTTRALLSRGRRAGRVDESGQAPSP